VTDPDVTNGTYGIDREILVWSLDAAGLRVAIAARPGELGNIGGVEPGRWRATPHGQFYLFPAPLTPMAEPSGCDLASPSWTSWSRRAAFVAEHTSPREAAK
jgi:hypothetical protein